MIERKGAIAATTLLAATILALAGCGNANTSFGETGSATIAPIVATSDVTATGSSLGKVVLEIPTIF